MSANHSQKPLHTQCINLHRLKESVFYKSVSKFTVWVGDESLMWTNKENNNSTLKGANFSVWSSIQKTLTI